MPKRKRSPSPSATEPAAKRLSLTACHLASFNKSTPSVDSERLVESWTESNASRTRTTASSMSDSKRKRASQHESSGFRASHHSRRASSRLADGSVNNADGGTGSQASVGPTNAEFGQRLEDSGIFGPSRSQKPSNYDELKEIIECSRDSESPVSENSFENFVQAEDSCLTETDVIRRVLPKLGYDPALYNNHSDVLFTNMKPINALPFCQTTAPKPDGYDGAQGREIDLGVRRALSRYIQPSKNAQVSYVPNHAFEYKTGDGSADVMQRQAMHDGAYGARAIHELVRFQEPSAPYDRRARTITNTYQRGNLMVYAHHAGPPEPPMDFPTYNMTRLGQVAVLNSAADLGRARRVVRNAREYCDRERRAAVALANDRCRSRGADGWVAVEVDSQLDGGITQCTETTAQHDDL